MPRIKTFAKTKGTDSGVSLGIEHVFVVRALLPSVRKLAGTPFQCIEGITMLDVTL